MKVKLISSCLCTLLSAAAAWSSPLWTYHVPSQPGGVNGFAVANDGSVLLSAGYRPSRVTYLDGRSGKVLWTRKTRGDEASFLRLSADGSIAMYKDVLHDLDGLDDTIDTLYLLDRRGRVLLSRPTRGDVTLSPQGDRIAVWDTYGESRWGMKVLDRQGHTLWQDPRMVELLDFTRDGRHLLTFGSGSRLWSATGKCLWSFERDLPMIPKASKDGRTLAVIEETKNGFEFLQIVHRSGPGTQEHRLRAVQSRHHQSRWEAAGVSSDGSLVVGAQSVRGTLPNGSGFTYYLLKAYSPSGQSQWTATIPPTGSGVRSVKIHPLGEDGFVAVSSVEGILMFFAVSGRGEVRSLLALQNNSLRFSPNGRKIAVQLDDELRLYSLPVPQSD